MKRATVISISAAVVAALIGGGVWLSVTTSSTHAQNEVLRKQEVERYRSTPDPGLSGKVPSQAVVNEASVSSRTVVDTSQAREVLADGGEGPTLIEAFGKTVDITAYSASEEEAAPVEMGTNSCLQDWAEVRLTDSDGEYVMGVEKACGRDVAVMIAGYGHDGRDLIAQSDFDRSDKKLHSILFDSDRLLYASASTEDNGANIVVVASGG